MAKGLTTFVSNHGPEIATALAVASSVSTVVIASKASIKANEKIEVHEDINGRPEDRKERYISRFKLVWRDYVPTAISCAGTIALIISSNRLSVKRQAAVASLLATTQGYLSSYKETIEEIISEEDASRIRDRVSQKSVEKNPQTKENTIVRGAIVNGHKDVTTIYDPVSGRYFQASRNDVEAAVNKTNADAISGFEISLNDFYRNLEIPTITAGEMMGWNTDTLIEIDFEAVMDDNGNPVLAICYINEPFRGFDNRF